MASGIECRLTCGHMFIALPPLPHVDDTVWCRRCDMGRTIVAVKEWSVRCTVCNYSRFTGASRGLSSRLATHHSRSRGHPTKINFAGKTIVTIGNQEVTESSLPNLLDT